MKVNGAIREDKGGKGMIVKCESAKLYCDRCGEQYKTINGYIGFLDDADGSEIARDAFDNDWKTDAGKHYCPNCCRMIKVGHYLQQR